MALAVLMVVGALFNRVDMIDIDADAVEEGGGRVPVGISEEEVVLFRIYICERGKEGKLRGECAGSVV